MPSKGRALLGIAALVSSVAMILHFQDFCFKEMRFLSDEQFHKIAEEQAFRNVEAGFYREKILYSPIKYFDKNQVDRSLYKIIINQAVLNKGDGMPYVYWYDRYFGFASRLFFVDFEGPYRNEAGREIVKSSSTYVIIGKCGYIWRRPR